MKVLLCSKQSRTWFFFWFIGIGIYLLNKAIKRYLEFKTLQFERVFEREFDTGVITMYLTSIIIAISSGLCCAICIIFQTGNYANDSMKFGSKHLDFKALQLRFHREQMHTQNIQSHNDNSSRFWIRMKNHFPAFFACFYFVMSFSFVITLPYLDSERIHQDLEPPERIWNTNLDVIFNPTASFDKRSFNKPVSPEFLNLCVSLIIHAISYSNVFWRFNKLFSLIFTIVIFINGSVFILDLALVEMLIKMARNSQLLLPSLKLDFQWIPFLSILSLMSYLFMVVLQLSIFEYGYNRVKDTLTLHSGNNITNDNGTTYNNSSNISLKLAYVWKQLCLESWNGIMLTFVVGITSSVFSILIKLPYIYTSMKIIYAQTSMNIVMVNVVVSIIYLILIVILWIYLILKSHWPTKSFSDPIPTLNGDCPMYASKPNSEIHTIPVYASVNRHNSLSPPVDQEPHFPIFCDKMSTQWRYSCSPASCAPNDSNSNSDVTVSGKNQDIGSNKKNYIYLSRINPGLESPNYNQGIYSQLVKLTPQLNLTENPMQSDNVTPQLTLSNDVSDNSSNQTVHIITPISMDIGRRTSERTSLRNRPEINGDIASPEYFNIITSNPTPLLARQLYVPAPSTSTDAESNNLCTQV